MDSRHLPVPGGRVLPRRGQCASAVRTLRLGGMRNLRDWLQISQPQIAHVGKIQTPNARDVAEGVAAGVPILRRIWHLAHADAVEDNQDNSLEHEPILSN